jgi:ABC-2 type transport system ATP-binding protein
MKRKLMICRALLTDPEILLLDEPTAGMDALSRRQMWNLLRQVNDRDMTILLTTHYIEEAEALCDRVAMINRGRLRKLGTPEDLISDLGRYTVDETGTDGLGSKHFHSREEAIRYLETTDSDTSLRGTTLEDVFVECAGRKIT